MTFTNITPSGMYMQCCHREVEPGGSFIVSWHEAKNNRALRAAMSSGALVWTSGPDEPVVEGSPDRVWAAVQEAQAKAAADAARAADEEAARTAEKMAEDDAAVKDNMARMGRFDVPKVGDFKVAERKVAAEKPITAEDVIDDGRPKSLADIRRHNRAVRMDAAHGGQAT